MRTRTSESESIPAADGGNAESAIEVVIVWGLQSVLHVSHLSPPRAFYVGDAGPDIDFVIGAEALGSSRLPLLFEAGGEIRVVVPRGASAELERQGGAARVTLEQLEQMAGLDAVPDHPGARSCSLRPVGRARISLGDFTFIVSSVPAEDPAFARGSAEAGLKRSRWTVGSAAAHVALLGLFHLLPPSSSVLSMDRIDTDSRLVKYAIEAHETPLEEVPKWLGGSGEANGGARASGEEGAAGAPNKPKRSRKRALAGSPDNPERTLTREQRTEAARQAGIIGVLRQSELAMKGTQLSAGGAHGSESIGGVLDMLLDGGGDNGLAMIGTGVGGGGNADNAIGLGHVGTRGRFGDGDGDGPGYGALAGGSYRRRTEHVPRIRTGTPDLYGSLSKEVIRRVINRHIHEIRFCYEQQLISRPDLQGRVAVKFIISPNGSVTRAVVDSSDVGSARVDSCIADAVGRMDFPAPEGGGLVLVTYPFLLSQTE